MLTRRLLLPRFHRSAAAPTHFAASAALAAFAAFALACAPAGDPAGTVGGSQQSGTGSVSIFLTDAPSDDFAAVNLTVTQIALLGGTDDPVTIFEGEETFDLLQLQNVSELFALADDVPVGTYRKIRLYLDEIEVVVAGEDGSLESHFPDLPASGKLDLLPSEPLEVTEDGLAIEVDIDVAKSIHLARVGAIKKFLFRPVVFVKILRNHFDGRLVRLHGTVRNIDEANQRFDLCQLRRPMPWLGVLRDRAQQALDAERVMPERPIILRCATVKVLAERGVFGTEGKPVGFAGMEAGDRATVLGHVAPIRPGVEVLAEATLLGPRGTYQRLAGEFVSELSSDLRIDLELRPGQGFAPGSVLAVQLFPSSLLFSRGGMELDEDALEPGLRAAATGVIVLSNQTDDVINTPILIVELDEDENPHRVDGAIVALDAQSGEITLATDDGEQCVRTFEKKRFFSVDLDAGESMAIRFVDLEVGDEIDAFGRPTTDDCFGAGVVIAFPQSDPGESAPGASAG